MADNRNSASLASFVAYCETHPTERFWQALRNWSGSNFIFVSNVPLQDTFYWEGKDG